MTQKIEFCVETTFQEGVKKKRLPGKNYRKLMFASARYGSAGPVGVKEIIPNAFLRE